MKDKKIAILGFGVTGQAATRYFYLEKENKIDIYDARKREDFDSSLIQKFEKFENIAFNFQTDLIDNISDFDLLIVSPGIPLSNQTIQKAFENNIPVYNDLTLFLPEWSKIGPTIGVTGTNGKSTTVSLLYEALQAAGQPSILVGNIGQSPLDELSKKPPKGMISIIEISSYQAELFKPEDYVDIAVITNITPDHLNRHQNDINVYASEKLKIINKEKTDLILTIDDPGIQKYVLPKVEDVKVFGISLFEIFPELENFLDPNTRHLKGDHNLYNIAFVLTVFKRLNIPLTPKIIETIKRYKGLEHRIEFLGETLGVKYINDSKSTTPDSTRIALEAFGDHKNIILIAGGTDKKVSFEMLKDPINQYVKFMIILDSEINQKMQNLAEENGVGWQIVKSMPEAVMLAKQKAEAGEVVLLSPASASFGMFKNFEDRGAQFKKAVSEIMK